MPSVAEKRTGKFVTNRPTFAKLKFRDTGRVGFDVFVWRTLCEIQMDFDEEGIKYNVPKFQWSRTWSVGEKMRSFINATMIQQYLSSARRDGQELLPQLVDKLITASVPRKNIKQRRILYGDQVGLTGADGILVIEGEVENQFVPSGISLWEFGTSNDPKSKSDGDFSKAEEKLVAAFPAITPAVTPDKATFVFITSKQWDATAWKKEKCQSSNWKDIRVYDAVDLDKWMEQCFAVTLWFAEVCGLPAEGFFDAEQYLKKQGILFDVSLPPDLVIAGRNEEKTDVVNLLTQSNQPFHVYGESVKEAAAFLAASALVEKEMLSDIPPLIFADGQANLKLLATFNDPLVVIPLDSEALSKVKELSQSEWRIVTPDIPKTKPKDGKSSIRLGKCERESIERYLIESMNISEHKARQIARNSKGSLAALLWMIGSGPIAVPRWATRKDATTHASLMLAGSWIGNNKSDVQIIEKLSRKDYRDIETLLQSAMLPDGPWIHQDIGWLCASKDFVWSQLAPKITETMLQDFHEIVSDVVGEIDPSLELKPSERYMASILGKNRKYSTNLRKGLVDSLVRLAIVRADGQVWADKIIGSLLDPKRPDTHSCWLSLVDVYSELAEASPSIFLDSLDAILNQNPKLFFPDSSDKTDIFGPTSAHVYLLWALERLAWQHERFSRVLIILAKLAENSPEAVSGNNPINSLVTILLPWSPQHNEKMGDAPQALEILYRVSPDIAWEVATKLLPSSHDVTTPNPKPEYRGEVNEPKVTIKEYWEFIRSVVEKMVVWADSNPRRLANLVEAFPELQKGWDKLGEMITTVLHKANVDAWDDKDKVIVKNSLDNLISHHREFEDADWALPESALKNLDTIRRNFVPSDVVLQYQPYFTWNPDDPEGPKERYGDAWDKWLEGKREQAAFEVYKQEGLEGLFRLSNEAVLPACVGQAVASFSLKENEIVELLEKTLSVAPGLYNESNLLQFGRGFASTCYRKAQDKWLEGIMALKITWSPIIHANLALCIPASPELWEKVDKWGQEAKELYWQNMEIGFNSLGQWEKVLEEWKKYNRPFSATELLGKVVDERHKDKVAEKPSAEQVMDVLELVLEAGEEIEPARQKGQMQRYYIERLFTYLDSQPINADRLARLEWSYLRLLENTKRGIKVLHQQVISSPEMFLAILKMVFRAEGESSPKESDKKNEALASQAFHLLRGINSIPGLQKTADGMSIDAVALHTWITESRKLAEEVGLLRVCDSRIGEILSYSPESPDGIWPCTEVRDVLEEIQSESVENGIQIGKYNQRGVVRRGKGGKQEWDLSQKYRAYAEKVRIKWPRTAIVLEGLANTYEREAKEWDKRAEWEEYE